MSAQAETAGWSCVGCGPRIENVLDMSRDAFVETDAHGNLTEWNRQSEVLFGWSRDEVLGRCITEFLIPLRHQGRCGASSSRWAAPCMP